MKPLSTRSIALIALVAIAVLAVGFLVMQNRVQEPEEVVEEGEEGEQGENGNTVTETIDTSDWQTYRNEELGFEVKYPSKDWALVQLEDNAYNEKVAISSVESDMIGAINAPGDNVVISYMENVNKDFHMINFPNKSFSDFNEFLQESVYDIEMYKIQEFNINGTPAFLTGTIGHVGHYRIVIESDHGLFYITMENTVSDYNHDHNNTSLSLREEIGPINFAILQSFTLLDPQESL